MWVQRALWPDFCSRPQPDLISKGQDKFKSCFSVLIQRTETTSSPGDPYQTRVPLGFPEQSATLEESP